MLYSTKKAVEAKRMLQFMERSTIYYLKQKGWTNVQIAECTGHHRDTIARVLREDVDKHPQTRNRSSAVAVFDAQIAGWLDQNLLVSRMLELARADVDHPYTGGDTAFYDYVRKERRARKQTPHDLALRFEGVPGEFLQIDWGEVRDMAFTKAELAGQTRYFFAARLKYSRYMYVSFHSDMREETLLRCLIGCFQTIGGVPWVVVTDNMKTAVLGRNAQHEPVWNPAYQKLAVEFTFHPEACAPASGNQKGAVENLVKYVKGNFIAGRTFHDDADLAEQCTQWLSHVNTERPSDATGQEPVVRLVEEQAQFSTLPVTAQDYGFFECVVVSREGLVAIETNRYSVPAHLIGRALTARIHATRIELWASHELVATHVRSREQHARFIIPAHFEAAFSTRPRGRVMVYRDWLCGLAPTVSSYVCELCHKRRADMKEQLLALYELAQDNGNADFVAALELAAEQHMYGAEYVRALLAPPTPSAPDEAAQERANRLLACVPTQQNVERDLAQYERYVANRDCVLDPVLAGRGEQA
jgi:transposase